MRGTKGRVPRLRTGIGALAGTAAVAAALSGCSGSISTGHIDAFDVDYDGTNLTLDIRDHNQSPINDDVDPAVTELHAGPAAETTVNPRPEYAFLGPPGAPVWILPQAQNLELLWPGWDTNDVPAGVFQNDRVTVRLLSVDGPAQFALFTIGSFGTPTVLFDTGDGLPDAMNLPRRVHGHGAWAFRAAGTYTLTVEVVATALDGSEVTSGPETYRFVVESSEASVGG